MQLRSAAFAFAVLSFALCGAGHAQSDDDHDHGDNDHKHYNTHRSDSDDDRGDCDDGNGNSTGSNTPSNTGGLYIVQAAPGRDLSHTFYPTYPIDVLVNDTTCLVQNAPFPGVQGAFVEPAGAYDLKISPANAAAPCTNAYVRETRAVVNAGQATYVVAALSLNSTLTTYAFNLQLPTVQPGTARVVLAHVADAGALDPGDSTSPLQAPGADPGSLSGGAPIPAANSPTAMTAGQSISFVIPAGTFTGNIYYAGTSQVALGPISDTLQSRSVTVYFIAGSTQTGSLQIISSKIPDVF